MKKLTLSASIFFSALLLGTIPGAHAAADLGQLNVYPNPVKRPLGHNTLTFDNITSQLRIRIYSASGRLVRDIDLAGAGNAYQWDLRNNSNQEVASGVYIYMVSNDAGEKRTGKIAVIR